MLQWKQLNSTATHTVWGYVSRWGGGLAMTALQKFEPSEFLMDWVILAWKLPDLPLLCSVCVLSSASLLTLSSASCLHPAPLLTSHQVKSRSAEHFSAPASQRVLGGEIVWSSGRRKGLVESGMEQPPLQFSTYLSSFSHGLSQYPIMRPVCLCP